MTLRAALYARFSSEELQKPTSIADQLTQCRRHAERLGAVVVAEFTDHGLRGSTRARRDGLAGLLAAARSGAFDVIVAEALDRVTRSGGDAWDIFEELQLAGVALHTIAQGRVEEMAVGFAGTVAALELKNTALRVRRGLAGVVAAGRWPGAPPYGYRPRIVHDARGERVKGLIEVDPAQAPIVRRVAAEYLAGSSTTAIARRLNAAAVPAPDIGNRRPGVPAAWQARHIVGQKGAIAGLLRNPIYSGEILWNRQTKIRVRRTGGVKVRANAAADHVRAAAPDLAILDAATWAAVQAEADRRAARVAAARNPSAANAPRRLFSGLVRCGTCGAPMATTGPQRRYRCSNRARYGAARCANSVNPIADQVEAQALAALRRDLLHPDVVAAFVDEYRKAAQARAGGDRAARRQHERALAEAEQKAGRLVAEVAAGTLKGPTIAAALAALEAEAARARGAIATHDARHQGAEVIPLTPRAVDRYRALADDLRARLGRAADAAAPEASAARDAARHALRQVVRALYLHPEGRGKWRLEPDADLTGLLGLAANPAAARALPATA